VITVSLASFCGVAKCRTSLEIVTYRLTIPSGWRDLAHAAFAAPVELASELPRTRLATTREFSDPKGDLSRRILSRQFRLPVTREQPRSGRERGTRELPAGRLQQSLNLISRLVEGMHDGDSGRSRFGRCLIPKPSPLVDGNVVPNN
jgi:hypothetical protein